MLSSNKLVDSYISSLIEMFGLDGFSIDWDGCSKLAIYKKGYEPINIGISSLGICWDVPINIEFVDGLGFSVNANCKNRFVPWGIALDIGTNATYCNIVFYYDRIKTANDLTKGFDYEHNLLKGYFYSNRAYYHSSVRKLVAKYRGIVDEMNLIYNEK